MKTLSNMLLMLTLSAPVFANNITPPPPPPHPPPPPPPPEKLAKNTSTQDFPGINLTPTSTTTTAKTTPLIAASDANNPTPKSTAEDNSINNRSLPIEQITVEGTPIQRSASTTKMNIPLIDTPAAIQIIPRDIIEKQGARRLSDVMRNVSGVQSGGDNAGRWDIFVIRGFRTLRIARDGFPPAMSLTNGQRLGLANVERVEVLKGPASVLYGAAEPGGLINVVTKRPEVEPRYSFTGKAGSFDFYNADIDLNQPLTKDGKLLARLNASYESADSFRDLFIKSEQTHLAPSLRWRPTARTTADFDLEYYKVERPYDTDFVRCRW